MYINHWPVSGRGVDYQRKSQHLHTVQIYFLLPVKQTCE
jgi:hypothetical protein